MDLGPVCIVKNCDLGLESVTLDLRPQEAFSRPWSQFFTVQTSQLARSVQKLSFRNIE